MTASASTLLLLLLITVVTAGRFSLHFSLPDSPFLSNRTVCVNLMGKPRCSIGDVLLVGDERSLSFYFEEPMKTQLPLSITLNKTATTQLYRRLVSVESTKSLSIGDGEAINVTLHCQKHYFGPACVLHCVNNARKTCDAQGQFTCQSGWEGPDCDQDIVSTPVSITSTTALPSTASDKTTVSSTTTTTPAPPTSDVLSYVIVALIIFLLFITCLLLVLLIFLLIKMYKPRDSARPSTPDYVRRIEGMLSPNKTYLANMQCNEPSFEDSGNYHSYSPGVDYPRSESEYDV